ncbi:MAG: peptidylprolyl isomerase [Elusimicrobiota bacterium]
MKKAVYFLVGTAFLLAGCSGDNVIAKAGKAKITVKSFQERLNDSPPAYRSFLSTDAGKKQFLDLMVREKIVLEAAHKAGIARKDEYKKMLAKFKLDQAKRAREYEEGMLMEMFIRDLYDKELTPTEAEINGYYEENKKDFLKPVEVTARHILLSSQEEAEKALARLKAGADFGKMAEEISTDSGSAMSGGKIGPFRKGELVPDFEKAVFALKPGKLSEVVKTQYGYHIVQKLTEKPLSALTVEQSKADIRKILEKTKFDNWIDSAKKKFNVNVKYELISKIQPEPAQMPMQFMNGQAQEK